jgi:hypothetical protein
LAVDREVVSLSSTSVDVPHSELSALLPPNEGSKGVLDN